MEFVKKMFAERLAKYQAMEGTPALEEGFVVREAENKALGVPHCRCDREPERGACSVQ